MSPIPVPRRKFLIARSGVLVSRIAGGQRKEPLSEIEFHVERKPGSRDDRNISIAHVVIRSNGPGWEALGTSFPDVVAAMEGPIMQLEQLRTVVLETPSETQALELERRLGVLRHQKLKISLECITETLGTLSAHHADE